jgi:hypothetical protein
MTKSLKGVDSDPGGGGGLCGKSVPESGDRGLNITLPNSERVGSAD